MRDNWLRESTDSSLYSSILMLKWNLLSLKIPSIIYFLLHLFLGIQREIIFFIIFEITLYWETYLKLPFISKIAVWMNSIVKLVNHIQTLLGFSPHLYTLFAWNFAFRICPCLIFYYWHYALNLVRRLRGWPPLYQTRGNFAASWISQESGCFSVRNVFEFENFWICLMKPEQWSKFHKTFRILKGMEWILNDLNKRLNFFLD